MEDDRQKDAQIDKLIGQIDANSFCKDFIRIYVRNGYGALPKREIDLLVLELFLMHSRDIDRDAHAYDLARALKLSPRRLRGLLDDLAYRDSEKDDAWCERKLRQALEKAELLKDGKWIYVQIEDGLVRDFAIARVRQEYGIVDTSFNTSIVKLTPEKYIALVMGVASVDDKKQTLELAKLEDKPSKEKSVIRLFSEEFAKSAGKEAGEKGVRLGLALLSSGMSEVSEILGAVFGKRT